MQCSADLDTYLMKDVVPSVPYLFDNDVVVLSANVTNYSFDQFAGVARSRPHRDRKRYRVVEAGVAPLRGATPFPNVAG